MRDQGRGGDLIPLLVRVDVPWYDLSRMRLAADLVAEEQGMKQVKRDLIRTEEAALQLRADQDQSEVREAIRGLGGTPLNSFWIVPGLAAFVPADRVHELQQVPGVVSVGLNSRTAPAQTCGGNPPAPWSTAYAWQPTLPGGLYNRTLYPHGAGAVLRQSAAHNSGYTGSATWDGHDPFLPFRIPVTIADSGFDLETDQWRGGVGCWCPPTTVNLPEGCAPPQYGVHGAFTTQVGFGSNLTSLSRVSQDPLDMHTLDVWSDVYPGTDINNTAQAIFWNRVANLASFSHGTNVAALAGGHQFLDLYGELDIGNCTPWRIGSDDVGPGACGLVGADGAAPECELRFHKIAQDAAGGPSDFNVQVMSVQQAAATGSWVYNLSYDADPDPLGLTAIAFDRAAKEFDMVICASAGDNGASGNSAQLTSGFFNGLIVGGTGFTGPTLDQVSDFSSRGPLAWPTGGSPTTVTQRDGVNICAPGGFSAPAFAHGLRAPVPEESYTQAASYFNTQAGLWVAPALTGASFAAPFVSGAAALLLGAEAARNRTELRVLTAREVRAVLLNEADESIASLPSNSAESPAGYGQGRVDLRASGEFFDVGGKTIKNGVRPSNPLKDHVITLPAGPVEITVTWDRVAFPVDNPGITNIDLELFGLIQSSNPNVPGALLGSSRHPENNYERINYNAPVAGDYTIRISVPSGGFVLPDDNPNKRTPYAIAYR